MSDQTLADELTAIWDEVRPVFADAFHVDRYQIKRITLVDNGYGGQTETKTTVEAGRCVLNVITRQGSERTAGGAVMAFTDYTAELRPDSHVTEKDQMVINGRPFAVTNVQWGGDHELFTLVHLEEGGPE